VFPSSTSIVVNDEHSLNAPSSIFVTSLPILILSIDEHDLNAPLPISVTLCGNSLIISPLLYDLLCNIPILINLLHP